MATSALTTETSNAPPAALLPPGLHDNDDEDATLLLKLQPLIFKLVDRVTAVLEVFRYAYDSNVTETAPPEDKASSENPDVEVMLLQSAKDKLKRSKMHAESMKPETLERAPALSE
jgi:hypothetical protein